MQRGKDGEGERVGERESETERDWGGRETERGKRRKRKMEGGGREGERENKRERISERFGLNNSKHSFIHSVFTGNPVSTNPIRKFQLVHFLILFLISNT